MNDSPQPRVAMIGFRAGNGGIGRVMTTLINALSARGITVDLLLPPGEHPDLDAIDQPLEYWTIATDDPGSAGAALEDYLRQRRPRAILSNKDQSHRLVLERRAGPHAPVIALRVGTHIPEKLRRQNALTAAWKQRRLANLYRKADRIIGISPGVTRALLEMLEAGTSRSHGPATHTIWNPVERHRIAQMAAEPLAHPWFTQKQRPVIVSVGRLVRAKNYRLLLKAFARLPSSLEARLVICGDGGQRERLLALAGRLHLTDRVDLIGHQQNPFRYVAAADLFVCSSLFEGANNALMEALALGTPCVSTDCRSGPREILDNGALGPLVPVNDAEALAAAMCDTLASPPDTERLREAAKRFDPELSAAHYAEALGIALSDDEGPLSHQPGSRRE